MVLSFHPCFIGDKNIICAGRPPGETELFAIKTADAIILPQGCSQALYEMAENNCPHVFPDYDIRFKYSGKLAQIQLFQETDLPHPQTRLYSCTKDFVDSSGDLPAVMPFNFPFVFKFSWGGEGDAVFLIRSQEDLEDAIQKAILYETSGNAGFLLQEYMPTDRTLRLAHIGDAIYSYWRIQNSREVFGTSLSQGARIDHTADPDLVAVAMERLTEFCRKTKINLAGFDVIFYIQNKKLPLFLEINYFFGRRGLGGSEKYYQILETEIKQWLDRLGLSVV